MYLRCHSPITKEQRKAVLKLFRRARDGTHTYREFRKRFRLHGMGSDRYIGGQWCNMFVGIEVDGYTHT